jgi:hypothetical protein
MRDSAHRTRFAAELCSDDLAIAFVHFCASARVTLFQSLVFQPA